AINVIYKVTMTANGCSNTQDVTVTINPNQPVSFTEVIASRDSFYSGENPITLTASPAGGVFSGTGVSNGVVNPCVAGAGTHTIRYTRTTTTAGQSSCTTFVEKTITVVQSKYTVVIIAD